jgi:hypothetical protein
VTLLKTDIGVRFGLRQVFWRHHQEGPRVLNALQTGHNCISEWDVDYRNLNGFWPTPDQMAFEYNVIPRISFDAQVREKVRRGPKLTIPMEIVKILRTNYANGRITRKQAEILYGISKSDIARILNGSAYWWCGGGLAAFMEKWK